MDMKKKFFPFAFLCISLLAILNACQDDDPELREAPTAEDATFSFTPQANKPNIVNFTSETSAFLKRWDFGNGSSAEGDVVQAKYPFKGTYEVVMTAYTSGGSYTTTQSIVIEQDDPTLLDVDQYNFLTGGIDAVDGKTWVMDKETAGHMGIGPAAGTWPEWYAAPANAKDGLGMYDDEITFKLQGSAMDYKTNGDVYVNASFGSAFPGAVKEPNGNDFIAPYNPGPQTWSLSETGGKWYLTIGGGGFFGYYSGRAPVYEILSITPDELSIRSIQEGEAGNAWYQRFIRKGFVRNPPPKPPYKIEDIFTNFDGASNITFAANSNGTITAYDNPAPVGANTSAKVGKYVKAGGQGGAFANVQVKLPYKMDLRQRHTFKLKAFIPSYNDYTTAGGEVWQSYQTLQKQVSVKLQNSELGGNAYTTQAEVIQKNLPLNEWVELTFDFTGATTDRTDFDIIVLQVGGEGIYTDGIFFVDDFELLPAVQ
jgi:hypothetical protein